MKNLLLLIAISTILPPHLFSQQFSEQIQQQEHQQLFEFLRQQDSLLFELGFNQCDTAQLRQLVSDDFEFYHDQSGIQTSKNDFIRGIAGLCHLSYKPTRELTDGSLEVHLLRNDGKLYGAIQKGAHAFYGEEEDRPKYLTSIAKFTHVWIIENETWKLSRVLSYDHIPAGK